MEDKESQNKNSRKWLALVSIPTQMGVIIYLSYFAGNWLDKNHPSSSVFYSKIFAMVGVGIAIYNVIRQVSDINKSE